MSNTSSLLWLAKKGEKIIITITREAGRRQREGWRRRRRKSSISTSSMRRRVGQGGNMRSVVGFLSQRGLQGDPLLTQDFQRRRLRGCRNLYKKDLLGHFGCVNAIEFSNNGGQWLVSGKATTSPSFFLTCPPILLPFVFPSLLLSFLPPPPPISEPVAAMRGDVQHTLLMFPKWRSKMVDKFRGRGRKGCFVHSPPPAAKSCL